MPINAVSSIRETGHTGRSSMSPTQRNKNISDRTNSTNLNESPEALLGRAMVQLSRAQDAMDEVYETLIMNSSQDGQLSGMDYDDAYRCATCLYETRNI